jgi:hypothetical protein
MSSYVTPALWFLAAHPSIGVIGGLLGIGLIAVGVVLGRPATEAEDGAE